MLAWAATRGERAGYFVRQRGEDGKKSVRSAGRGLFPKGRREKGEGGAGWGKGVRIAFIAPRRSVESSNI